MAELSSIDINNVNYNIKDVGAVANNGYFMCDTAAATAAKTVSSSDYALSVGGSIKIKMTNANTAASGVTLKIGSAETKPLYYAGYAVSASNTWQAGETVEVYYDGTNYQANNVAGGGSGSGVYDVSKEHPTSGPNGNGKFTIEYILNSSNVNELIPVNKRHPGMSIQFVSTYGNKYVQYRLIADDWSANTEDWVIADEGIYVDNPEFIYVKTDVEDNILWAIKTDGTIYYGAGVPQQIVDYINGRIADFSPVKYEDIVAFLNGLEEGDKTLQTLLNEKVDKVIGKSLIDADYASSHSTIDSPEYLQVTTDSDDKILEGITSEGVKQINLPIGTPSVTIEHIENPEWIDVTTDNKNKILSGRKTDGTLIENCDVKYPNGLPSEIQNKVNELQNNDQVLDTNLAYIREKTFGLCGEIPEYFDDNLASAINTARSNMYDSGINGETFVFLSDVHYPDNAGHSPALIKEITRKIPITNVFCGGDLINGGTVEQSRGYFTSFGTKMAEACTRLYSIFGNHDNNTYDGGIPFEDMEYTTMFTRRCEDYVNFGGQTFYYFDKELSKTRFIVLDSGLNGSGNTAYGVTASQQMQWLQDTIESTENGWHIIIFVHAVYFSTPYWEAKTPEGFMADVIPYLDNINSQSLGYSVEAIFAGHIHDDYSGTTTGGIPIILIECDCRYGANYGGTKGTKDEQSIDIVTIDYNNKNIKCVRVGRGSNRNINY